MKKTKIIQYLREMLEISKQDNDEFLAEYKKKYPDMEWACEIGYADTIKLATIETKIEFVLMSLEAEI